MFFEILNNLQLGPFIFILPGSHKLGSWYCFEELAEDGVGSCLEAALGRGWVCGEWGLSWYVLCSGSGSNGPHVIGDQYLWSIS